MRGGFNAILRIACPYANPNLQIGIVVEIKEGSIKLAALTDTTVTLPRKNYTKKRALGVVCCVFVVMAGPQAGPKVKVFFKEQRLLNGLCSVFWREQKSRPGGVAGSELAALRALLKYVAVAAQRGTNRGNAATAYSK